MICDPFGAFVPGAGCSSTTVPSCDGSLVGRSSTTGAQPACWSCVCAAVSSWPTTSGTVTSVLAAPEPCETLICMWSPRFALLPGWRACATTVPLGSALGTYLIAAISPAFRSASRACCSVLPTTSGTVTGCDCAGVVCGCARVVCFGCAGVVAAGAVVDGCELDGAPAETLIRTRAPPCAFSPGFGFCATTVPAGCSEGTRCVVTSNPADFRREAASDSLW